MSESNWQLRTSRKFRAAALCFLVLLAAALSACRTTESGRLTTRRPATPLPSISADEPQAAVEESEAESTPEAEATTPVTETVTGAAITGETNRIAIIGNDDNIYLVNPDGTGFQQVTDDASRSSAAVVAYRHVTWAPDSTQFAYVSNRVVSGSNSATLHTTSADGSRSSALFTDDAIAPFYLYWSPDSTQISFLSSDSASRSLGLFLLPAGGEGGPSIVDTGQPFYWSWAPDSSQVFIHTGARDAGRLAFLDLDNDAEAVDLVLRPTGFQAPAWSPDGERLLLAVETDAGEDMLVLIDPTGAVTDELAVLSQSAAFTMSPDGQRVALVTNDVSTRQQPISVLEIIDASGESDGISTRSDLIVAFFWSPDSSKIAYLSFSRSGRQQTKFDARALAKGTQQPSRELFLNLNILDIASGKDTFMMSIRPTEELLNVIPYFDQYERSATIWSPDSQAIVIPSIDDNNVSAIWLVDSRGRRLPERLTDGQLAFWSPG